MEHTTVIKQTSTWPVKSMAHYHPDGPRLHGDLDFVDGLCQDRLFMVVEAEPHIHVTYNPGTVSNPGRFLSQREDPILTQFSAELTEGTLTLYFTGEASQGVHTVETINSPNNQTDASVWAWSGSGIDQGDEVADWLSPKIGRPVRLVKVDDNQPRFVQDDPDKGKVGFADGHPIIVAGTSSLERVNKVLEQNDKPTIGLDRFRANIVFETDEPFIEDSLKEIKFSNEYGSVLLVSDKLCGRCPIPDIDQVTGQQGRSVRSALRKAGRVGISENYPDPGTFFGIKMIVKETTGNPTIRRGALVTTTYGSSLFTPRRQAL